MRNKLMVGIILWGLMALVQAAGLAVVLPTDALVVAIIMTTAGTALTVWLVIEAETRRLERVEDHKNRLAARALRQFIDSYPVKNGTQKVNEYRETLTEMATSAGIKFHDATGKSMTEFKPNLTPSAHYVVDDKGVHLSPGIQETTLRPIDPAGNPFLNYVEPSEDKGVVARQVTQNGDEIPMFGFDLVRTEEVDKEEGGEICKHCYRTIRGAVHTEGMYRGKMSCDPEDTQEAYGLVAEATGKPCGMICTGHASNKINPNK